MASPLNVAAPLVSVVAMALLSVAPAGPDQTTAVPAPPDPLTALPAASCSWTIGCRPSGPPLCAPGEPRHSTLSPYAAPFRSVIGLDVAGVRGPLSNRSV